MPYLGGKTTMLRHIKPNLPTTFRNYHEPFLGGGAVAIWIMEQCLAAGDTERTFYLSDDSENVVATWQAVKDKPAELEEELRLLLEHHSKEHFQEVRAWDREGLMEFKSTVQRAARFLYLSRTAFGGAVTSHASGLVRASYAADSGTRTYNFKNMWAVSRLLNTLDTRISRSSYEVVLENARYGDFIYLDPPYATDADKGNPLHSMYTAKPITHTDVKSVIDEATATGAHMLLSNADTATTRALFEGWAQIRPEHHWNCGGTGKVASELLVANWKLADHLAERHALAA